MPHDTGSVYLEFACGTLRAGFGATHAEFLADDASSCLKCETTISTSKDAIVVEERTVQRLKRLLNVPLEKK
jgi:hypothetical protein